MAVSKKYAELQQIKFDLFKEQNPETGLFDVVFEVGGKTLYAHKAMLDLVSPTFASMLSDRWAKKDEPIKIQGYGYDNFYQFITFLYSAQCQLTDGNIYNMVDLAEFYGVSLFKTYCDEYLFAMKVTADNVFELMELAEKYSMVQLKATIHAFMTNNFQDFVKCGGFIRADKNFVEKVVAAVNDKVKPEDLFQAISKWCETKAYIIAGACSSVSHAPVSKDILNNLIKNEFSSFLPHISFDKMEMYFLLEFVVPRVFIFPSPDELSKILCDRYRKPKINITNSNGQTLHGNPISDTTVYDNIKSIKSSTCSLGFTPSCYWNTKFKLPSTPSPLEKRDGVEWYLVYFPAGQIGVKHYSGVSGQHYLLAEMVAGTSGFELTANCKIEID